VRQPVSVNHRRAVTGKQPGNSAFPRTDASEDPDDWFSVHDATV
jgi:hypothetical protein